MPEKWTGRLVGKMHNERITYEQLAKELGYTKTYISMILNGKRSPDGIRRKMEEAVDRLVQRTHETADHTGETTRG